MARSRRLAQTLQASSSLILRVMLKVSCIGRMMASDVPPHTELLEQKMLRLQ